MFAHIPTQRATEEECFSILIVLTAVLWCVCVCLSDSVSIFLSVDKRIIYEIPLVLKVP